MIVGVPISAVIGLVAALDEKYEAGDDAEFSSVELPLTGDVSWTSTGSDGVRFESYSGFPNYLTLQRNDGGGMGDFGCKYIDGYNDAGDYCWYWGAYTGGGYGAVVEAGTGNYKALMTHAKGYVTTKDRGFYFRDHLNVGSGLYGLGLEFVSAGIGKVTDGSTGFGDLQLRNTVHPLAGKVQWTGTGSNGVQLASSASFPNYLTLERVDGVGRGELGVRYIDFISNLGGYNGYMMTNDSGAQVAVGEASGNFKAMLTHDKGTIVTRDRGYYFRNSLNAASSLLDLGFERVGAASGKITDGSTGLGDLAVKALTASGDIAVGGLRISGTGNIFQLTRDDGASGTRLMRSVLNGSALQVCTGLLIGGSATFDDPAGTTTGSWDATTGNIETAGSATIGATSAYKWTGRAQFYSPVDGQINFRNSGDSGYANLFVGDVTANGAVSAAGTGTFAGSIDVIGNGGATATVSVGADSNVYGGFFRAYPAGFGVPSLATKAAFGCSGSASGIVVFSNAGVPSGGTGSISLRGGGYDGVAEKIYIDKDEVDITDDLNFTTNETGPIIRSPNGTAYRIVVDNSGALSTLAV